MAELDLTFKLNGEATRKTQNILREHFDKAIRNAEIRMEIKAGDSGERLKPACFTIDKRKYSIRFSDETEDSVKVWIEPKPGVRCCGLQFCIGDKFCGICGRELEVA